MSTKLGQVHIEVSGAICELYRGHYVDVTRSEGFDLETAPSLVVVGGVLVSETGPTRLDLTNCLIGNGTQTLVRAVLGDFQGCSETMSLTLSDEKGSLAGMLASGTEASSGSVSRPRVKLEVGSGGDSSDESVPRGLGFECYPNPASGSVTIRLGATDKSNGHRGEVRVFDLRGKLIRTIVAEPRVGAVSWDGNDERGRRMASGVYFVLFNHGVGEVERDRVVLLR